MGGIGEEIKQTKPFRAASEMAFVALLRTADQLAAEEEAFLQQSGVTLTQYNVLRILRGAGDAGLICSEIGRRMITRVPDVTRLLDRMEGRGLIRKERNQDDRRKVSAWLTDKGLELVNGLDEPSAEFHADRLGRLGGQKLRQLVELLDDLRNL